MKTNQLKTAARTAAAGILSVMAVIACTKENVNVPGPGEDIGRNLTVKATLSAFSGSDMTLEGENVVRDMKACIFEGGKMTHVYDNLQASGNSYELSIDKHSGTLYMIANTEGLIDLDGLQSGEVTEEEWLRTTIGLEWGSPANFFSGSISLDGMDKSQTSIPLSLKRGQARFDLQFKTAGKASLSGVTVRNAAESAFLFPVSGLYSPENLTRGDVSASFEEPLADDTKGVLYVYEQSTGEVEIEVEALIDGKPEVLRKTLSEPLKRNTVYTLTVRKDMIDVSLEVSFEDWEQGGDTDLVPARRFI